MGTFNQICVLGVFMLVQDTLTGKQVNCPVDLTWIEISVRSACSDQIINLKISEYIYIYTIKLGQRLKCKNN